MPVEAGLHLLPSRGEKRTPFVCRCLLVTAPFWKLSDLPKHRTLPGSNPGSTMSSGHRQKGALRKDRTTECLKDLKLRARDVTQLVKCCTACRKAWVYSSVPHIPLIPALGKQRQGRQKFKVIFSYLSSSRPAWATRDAVSKN